MVAFMRKIKNKNRYRVKDNLGHIHAKSTSRKKAEAQVRLLNNLKRDNKGKWDVKESHGKGTGWKSQRHSFNRELKRKFSISSKK
jgi:hypothetical protein